MMKIAFTTLGCKVNQYETQAMKEAFQQQGFEVVSEDEPSDICVVNTCSVTNLSDRKSRQAIRRFKKNNPDSVMVVAGCYAQTGTEKLQSMEEVDIIAGTNEKHRLPEMVVDFMAARERVVSVLKREELLGFEELGIIEAMEGRTRAFIKIQEGCDRFCSYCIIPFARGPVRSRSEEEILEETRGLLAKGYHEIVLTGINTALYGADRKNKAAEQFGGSRLHEIIAKMDELPGDFRIRLSSVEPTVINADYVKRLLRTERLCPHMHLSVQSGSDDVLNAMNRRYDRNEYLEILKAVTTKDPLFGITTDIIVGFPGETEAEFAQSLKLVEEVDFCKVHVFRYSKRDGTKAANMAEQVSSKVKNERSARLIEAAEASAQRFVQKNEGAVRSVLFEELTVDGTYITGLSDNYIKVYVEAAASNRENLLNTIKKVKLGRPFLDGIAGNLI